MSSINQIITKIIHSITDIAGAPGFEFRTNLFAGYIDINLKKTVFTYNQAIAENQMLGQVRLGRTVEPFFNVDVFSDTFLALSIEPGPRKKTD